LEAALWAFYTTNNFKDGALKAVNLGDDADTTGAVYGQIAGACYDIPQEWLDVISMREKIMEISNQLFLSQHSYWLVVGWIMTLKYPIKLSSSVRDADGIPLALANTEDGGEAVVVLKNSAWVLSKGFSVSDVMRSPEASEEQLIEWSIIDKQDEPSRLSANERQLEMLKKLTPDQIDKAIDRGLEKAAVDASLWFATVISALFSIIVFRYV